MIRTPDDVRPGAAEDEYAIVVRVVIAIAIIVTFVFWPQLQGLWDGVSSGIRPSGGGQEAAQEPSSGGGGLSWTVAPGDGGDVGRIEVDGEVVGCIPLEDIEALALDEDRRGAAEEGEENADD